jgi:ABC-type branched-subunit amino acid transport system ATPase component
VRGVSKAFGGVKALNSASLEVQPGLLAGLIGPNGSGKSTLLNVVSGMIKPETGDITLDGGALPMGRPAQVTARGVARTFQHVRLLPQLSVKENVEIGGMHRSLSRPLGTARMWLGGLGRRGLRRELDDRVEASLGVAEVPVRVWGSSPSVLSYGVQRRVEIARALCGEPTLLLLDEPAAGMNDDETAALGRMLRGLCKSAGTTIVLVEHNLDLVFDYADHLTAFDRGSRIAFGEPSVVRKDAQVVESFLGAAATAEA